MQILKCYCTARTVEIFSVMDGRGAIMNNNRRYQVCSILDKDASPTSCHHFAPDILVSMRQGIFASFFLSQACQQGDPHDQDSATTVPFLILTVILSRGRGPTVKKEILRKNDRTDMRYNIICVHV